MNPELKSFDVVAIDGPSASGKSTVARGVAQALGALYVDSGSLYRGATWRCILLDVDLQDPEAVISALEEMDWYFFVRQGGVGYTIDGEDPGEEIRNEAVRESVSYVARVNAVREFVNSSLRSMRELGRLVMEGRDIGSVVFPDTPCKYYLDADPEERARRRHVEIQQMEGEGEVSDVLDSLKRRDYLDSTRTIAPLQIPLGAHVINTGGMSAEEVVATIVENVQKGCPTGDASGNA